MGPVKKIRIYLLAGVATSPTIFTECMAKLEQLFRSDGIEPVIEMLLPYGDASRKLVRQVFEVGSDLPRKLGFGRIGGKQAFRDINKTYSGEPLLLIGHSGGGAAAYQAAKMLHAEGADDFRVVQVGSPRMPIDPDFKQRVSYFHSVDKQGRSNDPITKIGSWGGFAASPKLAVPYWNRMKYAPGYVEGIPTIGGHADYFRHTEPFIDQQAVCNLDKTIGRMHSWLQQEAAYA
ncbi:lipase family protein [Paenibacillus protaetiae]|uniref:Fungal lipase-type domain-containing protein n=1 Tax=Paenibacillus protaetiae TaxID=2509456 RepID=A0A4P6EWC7_9BACL|nr:hypothetical protein [Paenibacillus protaetiae]QAY66905.1 hypothetical protein ET464_11375 [Paenibacillus protaetiae]